MTFLVEWVGKLCIAALMTLSKLSSGFCRDSSWLQNDSIGIIELIGRVEALQVEFSTSQE
jgi:hypothetical protein